MGNILLRLPPGTGAEMFGDPAPHQIEKVTKTDGSPLEEGVPEYLVEPLEHDISALDLNSGDVQLVDFGSGMYLPIINRLSPGPDAETFPSLL